MENLPLSPPYVVYMDEQIRERKLRMHQEFEESCPFEFKSTDLKHEKMPSEEIIDKIISWRYERGRKGLLLQGSTGRCKTRLAWTLIEKLMLVDGIRVQTIRDPSFAREYTKRLGNGTAEEWMEKLSNCPVLFIDDFGKAAVTQRYKEEFYDVLDSRTSNGRPIIITTQLDRATILSKFGNDDGKAIIRRILEYCEVIQFKGKGK
jgi:DNA replication protein DnaC